jgi:integrase
VKRANCSTRPRNRIKYLDQPQLEALFRAARSRPLRDRLLVLLCYRYGLRISEALALRTEDVDLRRGTIRVVGLKGGATLVYSLGRDLLPLLRRQRAQGDPGAFLFASREGEQLSRTRAWGIVSEMMQEVGLPKGTRKEPGFGPHALRHSLAVHMLDAGLALEHVKDALRHARIRSAEVYGELSPRARAGYAAVMERSDAIVKVRP